MRSRSMRSCNLKWRKTMHRHRLCLGPNASADEAIVKERPRGWSSAIKPLGWNKRWRAKSSYNQKKKRHDRPRSQSWS
jgi:hypothetical protein